MKKLREASLRVGDIILNTSTAKVSKWVRAATRSDISHAMIYVQDHSVIDATAEGVQARNTQRVLFEDDCSVYVLRLRDSLSEDQIRKIIGFVRAQVGTQYSTKEAVQTALGGAREWTKKQFCSRLVAQAYDFAGIRLVGDPNYCSPANLKDSSLLVEVQEPTISISDAEAALWQDGEGLPAAMRSAINAVMDGARKKNKDIQNFDDLHAHLAQHPEDDEYMCGVLEKSGYLTVWQIDTQDNPWHYNLALMKTLPAKPELEAYCRTVLSDEEVGPSRYIVNRGGYAYLSQTFGLRFFQMMLDLYDRLASLHQTRFDVATKWLEANNLLTPPVDAILRPHTPEWFAALELWNPQQAAMTRAAIETGGSVNVCSICGDQPANDYRLEEERRPPGGVDTMRLCDDCLGIRHAMDEPFVRLPDEATDPP